MSRSYRKPYATMCTSPRNSAAQDKEFASRAVRRAENSAIRSFKGDDYDELVLPERLECSGNNVWGWRRDGRQRLQFPPKIWYDGYVGNHDLVWAQEHFEYMTKYYERLCRK